MILEIFCIILEPFSVQHAYHLICFFSLFVYHLFYHDQFTKCKKIKMIKHTSMLNLQNDKLMVKKKKKVRCKK